jgi:hypothetical protein
MLLKTQYMILYDFNEYYRLLWYNIVELFALHQKVDVRTWQKPLTGMRRDRYRTWFVVRIPTW